MRTAGGATYSVWLLAGCIAAQVPPQTPPQNQPQNQAWIGQNGVVNSASRIPPTLAGGAIARGALFTIYGVRFGTLDHTRVIISSGGASANALVISTGPEQIDARMPETAPPGTASVVVSVDGRASAPFAIEVVASNPGLFSRNGRGWGPGRIDNVRSSAARSENSISNPAHPGDHIAMFATGLGDSRQPSVVVGGRTVHASRASERQGEEMVDFQIPADAAQGCYVPVYILAAAGRASNVVSMSIRQGSGPCSSGPVPVLDKQAIGVAVLGRTSMKQKHDNHDFISDEASVVFGSKDNRPVLSPLLLLPPVGTCTAYTGSLQSDDVQPNSISATLISMLSDHGLDAGSHLIVSRSGQNRDIVRERRIPGYYRGRLGEAGPNANRRAPPLFLDPGELTLAGSGGKDVGPFVAHASAPASFDWIGRDSLDLIDRQHPPKIQWRDPSPDRVVLILATNVDQITTATGTCLCVAKSTAGQFTIPPAVLANVPASRDLPGARYDQLFLTSLPAEPSSPIRAAGLQSGAVISLYTIGRSVQYR